MANEHAEIRQRLPWYVNGTLPEDELKATELHLRQCLPCNAALREELRLRQLIQEQDVLPLGANYAVGALMQRLGGSEKRPKRVSISRGPVIAAAFLGAVAVVWLVTGTVPSQTDSTAYSTLSDGPDAGLTRIDIVLTPGVAAEAFEELLDGLTIDSIVGPSAIGRYTVSVDFRTDDEMSVLLENLRADSRVTFAGQSFAQDPVRAEGATR